MISKLHIDININYNNNNTYTHLTHIHPTTKLAPIVDLFGEAVQLI